MELQKNVSYHNRLKRLNHQLALSEQLLQNHPHVKGQWAILQTLVHGFHLQMQWAIAGPSARLLMTFQSALQAQETAQSQSGFVGPAMQRLQQSVARLMEMSLRPSERDLTPLLLAFTQVVALGTIFVATQLLENWKRLFPHDNDSLAAKKAGALLKELGLTFILGSRTAEIAFRSIGEGLGLKDTSQKRITNIGMCFLLVLLILAQESETAQDDEFLDTLKRFMQPTLGSIEHALQEAEMQHLLETHQASLALSQVQVMRQALETSNAEAIKQVLAASFDILGISYQDAKQDTQRLSTFCAQLNKSFKNIFDHTAMTATAIHAV
jgi:hypothetical protein